MLDEDGSPTFTSRCREGHRLRREADAHTPWSPEGQAAAVTLLEHEREAWPTDWFAPDGHYISGAEWHQGRGQQDALSGAQAPIGEGG